MRRRFQLEENEHFRIIPHRGKGSLPSNPDKRPDPKRRGLLDQLPAKLKGYSHLSPDYCVVVLVDSDSTDCKTLKNALVDLYGKLDKKPPKVLFRIAVEETESWFLADRDAIISAYPNAKLQLISNFSPDSVVGSWEKLAIAIGRKPDDCDGADKVEWATKISPHIDLKNPKSPSLNAFLTGIASTINNSA